MENVQEATTAKSIISIQPRNHYVIVRATTQLSTSTFMLASGKINESDKNERVIFEVIGIGSNVKNLNIGDKVIVQGQAEQLLPVKENKESRYEITKAYAEIFKNNIETQELIKNKPKTTIVEYLLYTEFNIVAVDNSIE